MKIICNCSVATCTLHKHNFGEFQFSVGSKFGFLLIGTNMYVLGYKGLTADVWGSKRRSAVSTEMCGVSEREFKQCRNKCYLLREKKPVRDQYIPAICIV